MRAESVELGAYERVRGVRGGVALHLLPRLPVQRSLQLLPRQRCVRPALPAQYTGTTCMMYTVLTCRFESLNQSIISHWILEKSVPSNVLSSTPFLGKTFFFF